MNKKILLAVAIVMSFNLSSSLAYDYVFLSKPSDEYYSSTSVEVTTIPVTPNKIPIQTSPSAIYNSRISSSIIPIVEDYKSVIKSAKDELLSSDGSIGTLKIPEIDLKVKVYDGTTEESLKKGVGHFVTSDYFEGNVCIAGHNRGINSNFGKLKKLEIGDKISYITNLGTKKYEVSYIKKISTENLSKLEPTSDNRITLITCVENQPMLRLCIQGKEIE